MLDPALIYFALILLTMAGFIFSRWRYDMVAGSALLAAVYLGLVPADEAFAGFGHPAVIMVCAVLVLSKALQKAGFADALARLLRPTTRNVSLQVAAGGGLVAAISSVMNNVGALALMLPVTLQNAKGARRSASLLLIPLSFASMLGGLLTLIGTPPNLIVSEFRRSRSGDPFALFDFAPVGLAIALTGLAYLALIGWRLLPARQTANDEGVHQRLAPFVAEMHLPAGSPFDGRTVRDLERLCDNEVTIMAIIRGEDRFYAPLPITELREGDVMIVEGDPAIWEPLCDGVRLAPLSADHESDFSLRSPEVMLVEAVVAPNSPLQGKSVRGLRMHDNYGVNLLALSRQGRPPRSRLKMTRFRIGDVLLMQGEQKTLRRTLAALGCLQLTQRSGIAGANHSRLWIPLLIFAAALIGAAFGAVSAPIALTTAAAGFALTKTISLQEAYDSIEWPIVFLLGAMIPIGYAMENSGAAAIIANGLVGVTKGAPIVITLALIMMVSMWMSDLIHNTPTAVLMAPVALGVADALSASADPFLMAVAIGAASAYLTPIGHQSNTLVMGPGGYRFGDYARVGIGLQLIIILVGAPMLMVVWPPS